MSDQREVEEKDDDFDGLFRVASVPAYREIVQSVSPGFPEWLAPSSALDLPLLERIANTLNVHDGRAVLDLGCGGGGPALWVAQFAGCSVTGIDSSPIGIQTARALAEQLHLAHRTRFVQADATATGCDAASFDGVMSIFALMFIDPHAATREIARVLRPNGIAVILTAEALTDPPRRPTMVPDYRPVFEAACLTVVEHEALGEERWHDFFTAALGRADALRREAGRDGESLIDEATRWLANESAPYSRSVLVVARRV